MTSRVAKVSAAARRDLDGHALWLHDHADADVEMRFGDAVADVFERLANTPKLGAPLSSHNPRLADLRKWAIRQFRLIVFYRPVSDGVEIIRVLHAARDWMALLDIEHD